MSETPRTDALLSTIIERRSLENRTARKFLRGSDPHPSDVMDIPQSLIDHARTLERLLRELRAEFGTAKENEHLPELSNLLYKVDQFLDGEK